MKKISILCSLLLLFCCSCSLFVANREYVCQIEEIKFVEIVMLGDFDREKNEYEYTVLSQITDYATFVDRLTQLQTSVNGGQPYVFNKQAPVVRIEYQNGDYDLIQSEVQCFGRSGKITDGKFLFNQKGFQALIEAYSQ